MHPVSDVAYGHVSKRPAWVKPCKKLAAHLAVQPADRGGLRTAAQGEVRHVEGLIISQCINASHCKEAIQREATVSEQTLGVLPYERCRKRVEIRGDGRVRGEHIACPGGSQRLHERYVSLMHVVACALKHHQCRVALVEVSHGVLLPQHG